ncbi:MAG: hypothetical protein VB124_01920 [Burkholderia sp.]
MYIDLASSSRSIYATTPRSMSSWQSAISLEFSTFRLFDLTL